MSADAKLSPAPMANAVKVGIVIAHPWFNT